MYVGFQTPAGIIMDRMGPRRLLCIAALVCSLGAFIYAQTHSYYIAIFARLCMGGGAAFAFVGIVSIIREWFERSRKAFLIGITELLIMVAAVRGVVVLTKIMEHHDWRFCMKVYGLLFFVVSIACGLLIRNNNPLKLKTQSTSSMQIGFGKSLLTVMRNSLAWINGLYIGVIFSVVTVFSALWVTPFFKLHLGVSSTDASKIGMMTYIGIALGCPLFGWLSQKCKKRKPFLIFSAVSMVILFYFIVYWPYPTIMMEYGLMFLMGILSSGYILAFIISDDIAPDGLKSTFMGFTNSCCLLTAPILQPLIGAAVDFFSGNKMHTVMHYQKSLSIMMLVLFLAIILAFCIPETFKEAKE